MKKTSFILSILLSLSIACGGNNGSDDPPGPPDLYLTYQGGALDNGTQGESYTANVATAAASGGTPTITYAATGLPGGLNISSAGIITGTPAAAGDFTISVVASATGYTSATAAWTITIEAPEPELPFLEYEGRILTGLINVAFNENLATATGTTGITYEHTAGTLPAGLNFNNGVLSGTPNQPVTNRQITITARAEGFRDTARVFTITIEDPTRPPLSYTGRILPEGKRNTAYEENVGTATGATSITYALAQGSTLPAGLNLSGAGMITGTPTVVAANHTFVVVATAGASYTDGEATFTITIVTDAPPPPPPVNMDDFYIRGPKTQPVFAQSGVKQVLSNQMLAPATISDTGNDRGNVKDLNGNGQVEIYENWAYMPEGRAIDLLERMTKDEKVGLLVNVRLSDQPLSITGTNTSAIVTSALAAHVRMGLSSRNDAEPFQRARYNNNIQLIAEASRLGVPFLMSSDMFPSYSPYHVGDVAVANGLTSANGLTRFPPTLALAAAIWDSETRAATFGRILSEDARGMGVRLLFGPPANLATEPRWSGVTQTFGDGAIVSTIISNVIAQMQGGADVTTTGVAAVLKSFPGEGPQKNGVDSRLDSSTRLISYGSALSNHIAPF